MRACCCYALSGCVSSWSAFRTLDRNYCCGGRAAPGLLVVVLVGVIAIMGAVSAISIVVIGLLAVSEASFLLLLARELSDVRLLFFLP